MTAQCPPEDDGALRSARERRLVQRMRRGESAALDEFCNEFLGRLYRFAARRMERPEDAEEVVQTVVANAVRRIETFRGDASLFAWLTSICRREIARHHAASQRHSHLDSLDGAAADDPVRALVERLSGPVGLEPEAGAERREIAGLVWECLDRMPRRQALALSLKYVQGQASRQIAARLGLSDQAVQSLLARARRTFREVCDETLRERD